MIKVAVGMSGGVDSAVTAYILKQQGCQVTGVTIALWDKYTQDAQNASEALGIPHYTLDFREQFKTSVMNYFAESYLAGLTPNPCIMCNRYVKWRALLKAAEDLGADYVATGHYSSVIKHPETGRFCIRRADTRKDQSYALYRLTQEQLSRTIMPLGKFSKAEIRQIAESIGLSIADKPDSQEICFIPDGDYAPFVLSRGESPPGDFIDIDGKTLGRHKGIINYTIGQRKGFGVGFGRRIFVKKIDPVSNTVTLADNQELFSKKLSAVRLNYMAFSELPLPIRLRAKIRYGHQAADCAAYVSGDVLHCEFDEPQRAITPGQSLVLYDDYDCVAAGGIINGE